jgi:hypothetical protein
MTATTAFRLVSVAALLTLSAQSAAAQVSEPSNIASPASLRWVERPTGEYYLELAVPNRINKVSLTISDSAGALAANFQPVGDRGAHPMTVRMQGTDMILEAYTPRGLFEIVLARSDDRINGRWSLGAAKGLVQGRVLDGAR